jgi:hypothetical protein
MKKILLPAIALCLFCIGCGTPKAALDGLEKNPDSKAAFEAYGKFADEFKNDPESVRAYFKRGEILEKEKDVTSAKIEYTRAIERNRSLTQKNERFAALSLYRFSNILFDEYKATTPDVVVPASVYGDQPSRESIRYSEAVGKKSDLKKTLAANLNELLIEMPKLSASATEYVAVAQGAAILSEDYGDGFAAIPKKLEMMTDGSGKKINSSKRIAAAAQANVDAAAQYGIAAADYAKLHKQFSDARTDSLVPKNVAEVLRPVAEQSAMKTVEMRYKAGFVYEQTALMYLGARAEESVRKSVIPATAENPTPIAVGDVAELAYLSAINERFARPAIEQSMKSYRAGLRSAAELGVMTESYAAMSEQGILDLSRKSAERADSLARASLKIFDTTSLNYQARLNAIKSVTLQDTAVLVGNAVKLRRLEEKHRELVSLAISEYDKAFNALKEITSPESSLADTRARAKQFATAMTAATLERQAQLSSSAKKFNETAKKERKKSWYGGAALLYQSLAAGFAESATKFNDEIKKADVLK